MARGEGGGAGRGGGSDLRRTDTAHLLNDAIKQFSPRHVLQHHVVKLHLVREVLVDLDHVRVVEHAECVHLCVYVCVELSLTHIVVDNGSTKSRHREVPSREGIGYFATRSPFELFFFGRRGGGSKTKLNVIQIRANSKDFIFITAT